MTSERNAKKLSKEIGELHNSLEKSYEELSYVNEPPETPKVYAKTDRGGNVIFISDLFKELSGQQVSPILALPKLFPEANVDSEWMEGIIEKVAEGGTWTDTLRYEDVNGVERWVEIAIVPTLNEKMEIDEWVVLGSDITRQKQAEKNMREKNRSEVEKKINQQKFRSVLILEGQEEERKRLAMDIHDGIGQMLTSLKFQIESIETKQAPVSVVTKLNEIQHLAKDIIKEVRRVTFNLKPTVLGDFGLQAAINVFVTEIRKLTDIDLVCRTSGNLDIQLPQKVENNIFRIIQEAINNAIKHSGATRIEVLLMPVIGAIIIKVTDNGQGFDEKSIASRSASIESGHGFFNMYERTEYINGKLDIKSIPGQETSVTLTVPVKNSVVV
jgi:PAS domain S-box-containing protein